MMNNNYFRLIADSVMSSKKSVDVENFCIFPVLSKKDGKEHFGDTFLDMDVTYHFGGHMTNSLLLLKSRLVWQKGLKMVSGSQKK